MTDEKKNSSDEGKVDVSQVVQNVEKGAERPATKIPDLLPLLPVRNLVIFPAGVAPLTIKRPSSLNLISDVVGRNRLFAAVLQRDPQIENPAENDIYRMGCACTILRMIKLPNEMTSVIVQGLARVKIEKIVSAEPYMKAHVTEIPERPSETIETQALAKNLVAQFQKYISLAPGLPEEIGVIVMNIDEPGKLADFVAYILNIKAEQKQQILEILDLRQRLQKTTELLNHELEILELGSKIQKDVESGLTKSQREFYLRQQLEAIKKELGEEGGEEIDEIRKKIKAADMPEEALKEAERELDRLARMHPSSAEYTVARTYLDWLTELPWKKSTKDNLDIKKARKILDQDHYNLEKVKERILEFLAILRYKQSMKGAILCFVGPPGVGKTSLGQSIARALGRKFHRMSLGGIRDEAEIRGHRRTYIGALPGRIIQAVRRAGSNNPLIMLDEIDKIGMDYRGDPSSALLEVLDPEQNHSFTDHYLDVPFDLSKTMFITTANILDTIPPALLDRMEVLRLPGYTQAEKVAIARKHLLPKLIKENGLEELGIAFEDSAFNKIIEDYTREAGLRNLEREIANVLRKIAKAGAEGKKVNTRLGAADVRMHLGPEKFVRLISERITEPGIAVGLAWTPVGGEVLIIEATGMKGKKGLLLTGSLGEVMKESAQAALSYVRANAKKLGIDPRFFESTDIHIHIPEGATKKDGPSAGITLALALVSLLSGRKLRQDIAMTGEITLRGELLPVGGIKEKVLAARRYGIKEIFLPKQNEKDLEELMPEIKKEIRFIPVTKIDEVIEKALEASPAPMRAKKKRKAAKKAGRKTAKKARVAARSPSNF